MKRIVAQLGLWTGLVFAAGMLIAQAFAQAPRTKPRVPPGADPGGVAVAIIGGGINYTKPDIAPRLARDGEGEIIGWDFVDGDRRPFSQCVHKMGGHGFCEEGSIIVAGEYAPRARFVIARIHPDQPKTYIDAMRFVAASPAKVVLIPSESQSALASSFAVEAARRYPALLIVSGPEHVELKVSGSPEEPTPSRLPTNLLLSQRPWDAAGAAAHEWTVNPQVAPAGVRDALLKRGLSQLVAPSR